MSLTFLVWCFLFGTIIPSRRNYIVLPTPIPLPHPCPADTQGTPLLALFSCAQPDYSCPETSQPHGCRSDTLSLTRDPDNTARHTLCRIYTNNCLILCCCCPLLGSDILHSTRQHNRCSSLLFSHYQYVSSLSCLATFLLYP